LILSHFLAENRYPLFRKMLRAPPAAYAGVAPIRAAGVIACRAGSSSSEISRMLASAVDSASPPSGCG
jgi:hypothetical protein